MLLLSPIHDILEKVCSHSLTLTAHVWNPDSFLTDDAGREHLLTGIYNGGLIGATAAGRPFLEWWAKRLESHCICDLEHGLHYDQRWLDFAPSHVEDLCILRDPGVNTAYWNLKQLESGDCRSDVSKC